MSKRESIEIEGYHHGGQPIPAACRVGDVIMTSGVFGLDIESGILPDDVCEQAKLMFANLEKILQAGGSGFDDVVKMTVYVKVPDARTAVNDQWLKSFPDSNSRPARHTFQNDHLPANMVVQCDAVAIVNAP